MARMSEWGEGRVGRGEERGGMGEGRDRERVDGLDGAVGQNISDPLLLLP